MSDPAAAADPTPKYDVAISFTVKNETVATELNARLEGALNVFFFPRKQDTLTGTDGMESMREPFLDARVNVVIFDDPWGATPWTRIEETAIKERCFNDGWDGLMFVQVSKTPPLPNWLPKTHVRFSLADFGIEELAGAIKAQVQRQGGKIKRLDAAGRAKQVKAEQDYLQERDRLFSDATFIHQVQTAVAATAQEVARLAEEANKAHQFQIEGSAQNLRVVLRANGVSISMRWEQPINNRITDFQNDECQVEVGEYTGYLTWPNDTKWFHERAIQRKVHKFKVEVSQARTLMWKEVGKAELIAPEDLADRVMQIFLDLLSRANKGTS